MGLSNICLKMAANRDARACKNSKRRLSPLCLNDIQRKIYALHSSFSEGNYTKHLEIRSWQTKLFKRTQ